MTVLGIILFIFFLIYLLAGVMTMFINGITFFDLKLFVFFLLSAFYIGHTLWR